MRICQLVFALKQKVSYNHFRKGALMNRLSTQKRAQVVFALVEGNSINSIVRMTGFAKHAILKLIEDMGYSPATCIGCDMKTVSGVPDPRHLTMRMSMRRFTRLTNGFSKKIDNHGHAVALHFMYYNFVRIHKTLRVTPAMEAGIAGHVWSMEELVSLLDVKVFSEAA
jgi:hypothetical protein